MRRLPAMAVAAVLLLSACGTGEKTPAPGATGPAATGGTETTPSPAPLGRDPSTLVVAVDAFAVDFDPASAYLLSEALIWRGIYESLIRLKGDSAS